MKRRGKWPGWPAVLSDALADGDVEFAAVSWQDLADKSERPGQAHLHWLMTMARKLLKLRRDDVCSSCASAVPAGSQAYWLRETRTVLCLDCADRPSSTSNTSSAAGASARREHERRSTARETRYRERFGTTIGGWAARLSSEPQHVRSWAQGAHGEEANARRLEQLVRDAPVTFLHDRRIPGSRANIDHIAIAPGGVTVIDSKNYTGKVRVDWRGGLFSERKYDLFVDGRKRTELVESVERQIELVGSVLTASGLESVDVTGALCFSSPEGLPLFRHLRVRSVAIEGTRHTAKLVLRPGDDDEATRSRISSVLAHAFPPA